MSIFRVVIEIDEPNLEEAENHILSLSGSDLVDEIVEVEEAWMYGAFESEEEYEEFVKNGDWFIDTESDDYWKKVIEEAKKWAIMKGIVK